MVSLTYREPYYICVGKMIFKVFLDKRIKGNFVSIISECINVLRQQGPAGLEHWVALDRKRQFLQDAFVQAEFKFQPQGMDFNDTWTLLDKTMRILCYAKKYGKSQK